MITFITPYLPSRGTVSDLAASLDAQTSTDFVWLKEADLLRHGPAVIRNRLVALASSEWVNPIDDDDLLDPTYVEKLTPHLTPDVDVVYAWCRVDGDRWPVDYFQAPLELAQSRLRHENRTPNCIAIRRSLWNHVGGQRSIDFEDWDFLLRAQHLGARFRCIEEPLWTYRMSDGWTHLTDEVS